MAKMYRRELPPSRVEETENGTETTTYVAWSSPANPQSLKNCVIMRIVEDTNTGITDLRFANGSYEFDHDWEERASYDYEYLSK